VILAKAQRTQRKKSGKEKSMELELDSIHSRFFLGVLCAFARNFGGIAMNENELSAIIVDAALKVHRALGPGLLESVYEGVELGIGFRADLIVNRLVLIELKSVEALKDVFASDRTPPRTAHEL
jgi:hypothetical protein